MSQKQYLTVEDVAKRFGVNSTTIYRLVQKGSLPAFKVGGQWRFSDEMLSSWVVDQVTVERFKVKNDATNENENASDES